MRIPKELKGHPTMADNIMYKLPAWDKEPVKVDYLEPFYIMLIMMVVGASFLFGMGALMIHSENEIADAIGWAASL